MYKVAVLTISDTCSMGGRVDLSGKVIIDIHSCPACQDKLFVI